MKFTDLFTRRAMSEVRAPSWSELRSPWRELDYVAIDLETTGLRPGKDHIISFGAVPVRAGRILPSESAYSLVRTRLPVPGSAAKVHGIRSEDLTGAPTLAKVVPMLDELLAGRVLIAHGAWIETSFLRRAFESQHRVFRSPIVDTSKLVRHLGGAALPAGAAISLEYAASRLGLPVHTPHHSLGDALTTANVFIAVASKMGRMKELTAADLVIYSTQ